MHTEIFDSPSTFMATLKLCQSHPWQQEGYQEEHLVWPGAKCAMKTEWMNTITVTFPVADSFSFYCPSGSMKTPSCTSLRILSSSSCPALMLIWSIQVKPVQKCCFCFLLLCLICICSSCEMTAGEDKKRALGCSKFALNWLYQSLYIRSGDGGIHELIISWLDASTLFQEDSSAVRSVFTRNQKGLKLMTLLWHTLRLCLKLCLSHTISIKESKPLMESKSKTPNSLLLVDNSRKELFMACETFAERMRKDRSNKCQDLAATLLFSASIADPAPTLTTFTSAWEELLAHSNNPLFSLALLLLISAPITSAEFDAFTCIQASIMLIFRCLHAQ